MLLTICCFSHCHDDESQCKARGVYFVSQFGGAVHHNGDGDHVAVGVAPRYGLESPLVSHISMGLDAEIVQSEAGRAIPFKVHIPRSHFFELNSTLQRPTTFKISITSLQN